jgi:phosphoenolpyruvate carboxylase
MRNLKRKLFSGVDTLVAELEHKLYRSVFYSKGEIYITLDELLSQLNKIRSIIIEKHQSLYLDELEALFSKNQSIRIPFCDIRHSSEQ